MRKISIYFVFVLAFLTMLFPASLKAQSSVYGDANGDGIIDIGDVVYLINYLFRAGPEPYPVFIGDVNGDDLVDIGDIVYLINYLYKNGPPPKNFHVPPDSSQIVFDDTDGLWIITGRIIVQFQDGITADEIDSVIATVSGTKVGEAVETGQYAVDVPDVESALPSLQSDERVDFALKNFLAEPCQAEPDDPYYLFYQHRKYLLFRAPLAWEVGSDASNVVVVILDSGADRGHEDLENNLLYAAGGSDESGHGTFVSGIVGAEGNNDLGCTGMAWTCEMISYKVSVPLADFFNPFQIVQGFEFIDEIREHYGKKVIVNMSFGCHSPCANLVATMMWPSVVSAWLRGDLLIAAAGNGPANTCGLPGIRITKGVVGDDKFIPASFPEVLAVGSVNSDDYKEEHSNYGPQVIAAPENLWSTDLHGGVGSYICGTSFAAPMVSGLAALIWSRHPELTNEQVRNIIINSADTVRAGFKEVFGLARANAYRALKLSDGIHVSEQKFPNSPSWQDPEAVAGDGYVAIYWSPVTTSYDDGALEGEILGYYIYRKLASDDYTEWGLRGTVGAGSIRFLDEDVTNGWAYDYRVSAYDDRYQEGYWTPERRRATPTSDYHYITGFVRDLGGYPISGAVVTVSGGASESYLTGDDGYYEFMHLAHGLDYTVTPDKSGWIFDPPSIPYEPLTSNYDFQNFEGTQQQYYYVKGYVRDRFGEGVADVTITLSGSADDQYITSGDGYYQFLALEGGLYYKVVPSKTDWVFDPDSIPFNPLSSDMDDQDFVGTPYYYIKGHVREDGVPMESVWVELSGAATEYYHTGADGYYEFLNVEGLLDYTVTPSKVGWYFVPDQRPYNPLDANKDNQDFDGHEIQTHFYIKGYIDDSYRAPMESVTVTLSGGASDTYLTGPSGYYEFLDLAGGPDYTVTPSKPAYAFTPPSRSYTPLSSDQDDQDFTGTLCPLYDITGYVLDTASVGMSDVVVHLTGAVIDSYTTVADGYYEFLDLQGCLSYTVTPSKQGRCFSPPARDYASLQADQDSQNFIGVPCPPSTDFKVTDFVSGSAGYPRVSANNAGSFVVGWHDDRLGPNHDVFAQRYVSIAQPVGSNFKVNDAGAAWNYDKPGVAITANGSFVLAWRDSRTDNQYKIYSQRYDSSGNSLGSNYRVDSDPTGTCRQPGIAIDGSRKFTVVWFDRRNGKTDVFGQRYDSLGSPLGSNFVVNDVTTGDQDFASIGMNSSGSFVVCWLDNRSLSGQEVYCRRFNSAGTPLGASFKVNTIGPPSASTVRKPDVTIDDAGNFVVVWQTSFYAVPEDSFHIYAQRYNSSGSPIGSNFRVNEVSGDPATNQHYSPAVAMDGGGNFVIVWHDLRNGGRDIYGQEYNSSGSPIGSNFRVADDTTNAWQVNPDVSANGTYIYVTWSDERDEGGYYAIYAKVIPWSP